MNPKAGQELPIYGGIRFGNREGDLSLDRLRISRWDGRVPAEVKQAGTRIQLRDGKVRYGEIIGYDSESQSLVIQSTSADEAADEASQATADEQTLAADTVAEIAFSGEAATVKGSVRLSLHTGLRLRGDLVRIAEDALVLSCSALKDDFEVPLENVRTLMGIPSASSSATSKQAQPAPDGQVARLEVSLAGGEKSFMKGILVPGGGDEQSSPLHWQPRGSDKALPLLNDVSGRLVYRDPPPKPSLQQKQMQARRRVQRPKLMNGLLNAFTGGNGSSIGKGGPAIYLRAGDKLPSRVESIDSRGVTFKSPLTEATFVPHSEVKAIELITKGVDGRVTSDRRDQLLTLPRLQRNNPPTHLLVSIFGDYLRCRLVSLDDRWAVVEVRLEQQRIERKKVARIIWLGDPPPLPTDTAESLDESTNAEVEDNAEAEDDANQEAEQAIAAEDEAFRSRLRVQAVRSDGVRLTFTPEEL
ncbi:MAG: hypothetical protein RID07_14995, partial [Lacipirellulaceae bacterium]